LALEGGEWSASCPSHFTPGERDPDTHWISGWVGLAASLDTVEKRQIPNPCLIKIIILNSDCKVMTPHDLMENHLNKNTLHFLRILFYAVVLFHFTKYSVT
jgi:hypothetical protein